MQPSSVLRTLSNIAMGRLPLPDDLIHEVVGSEHSVKLDLHIVGDMPVAVIPEGAGWLEDAVKL